MTVHLHKEIEKLKKKILSISAHVDQAIEAAVRALKDRDKKLAQRVIDHDAEIDQISGRLKFIATHIGDHAIFVQSLFIDRRRRCA